jgi:PTH1 family peptidyl-tRNA hydrolase
MIGNNNKILIVGLGNPNYDLTVHNVGSLFIQHQIKTLNCENHKECFISPMGHHIYYAFNVSTMNISGEKIREILKKHNISHLIVLYDDIRIKYGQYKMVFGGPHTGHNGIKSIVERCSHLLCNGDFYRVRIGVGPKPPHMELSHYVLSRVTEEDSKALWTIYGNLWIEVYKTCQEIMKSII